MLSPLTPPRDPSPFAQARLVLHDVDSSENRRLMKSRLGRAGGDMRRVHFLPAQPHHKLLSLYSLSDVVLDSYPASGYENTFPTTRRVRSNLSGHVLPPAPHSSLQYVIHCNVSVSQHTLLHTLLHTR